MKKMMFSLVGILLLIGALPAALSAQTGSPPASFTGQANGGEPVIGEPVTYVDASGNPAATIVVEEVERVWEEYGEYDMPEQGAEYVAFTVTVESTLGRGALEVRRSDFSLQDRAGFVWDVSYADAADGVEVTPLDDDLNLASGDSATFLVVFEVLQGQEIEHLYWHPESDRMITIAALVSS